MKAEFSTTDDHGDEQLKSVLIVDDDALQRELMRRLLSGLYNCRVAVDVDEARCELALYDFALVLCDINMPGQSGLELARELAETRPEIAVTMVTGVDDPEIAKLAMAAGALDYIVKPYRANELRIGVANSLRRSESASKERQHLNELEQHLRASSEALESTQASLTETHEELDVARLDAIQRLCLAVEARDFVTAKHINGMVQVVKRFALALGYEQQDARAIGLAASMHDVGKIGIPDAILLKPGPLTDEERENMQRHCEIGFNILDGSPNQLLQMSANVALTHHERHDGKGYPQGLAGDQIPMESRIVQIIDVYSALTSDRPYRRALDDDVALQMIKDGSGKQFDPVLVQFFIDSIKPILDEPSMDVAKPPSTVSSLAVTSTDAERR